MRRTRRIGLIAYTTTGEHPDDTPVLRVILLPTKTPGPDHHQPMGRHLRGHRGAFSSAHSLTHLRPRSASSDLEQHDAFIDEREDATAEADRINRAIAQGGGTGSPDQTMSQGLERDPEIPASTLTVEPAMETRNARPIAVTAFIDWKSQMHNARVDKHEPVDKARQTLWRTARAVHGMLSREEPTRRFDVVLRLYHGWHRGWEKTENLRAIMQTIAAPGFPADYSKSNVRLRENVQYGHTLLSALSERRHDGRTIHLANTVRRRNRTSPPEEKMVDTALAVDLLHWARESPTEWALVLSEDDDIVPPVFTAEAWIKAHGGRAFIVRRRQCDQYVKLDGLLKEWKQ